MAERGLLVALALFVAAGCERAFVPVVPPDVRVAAPGDLDEVVSADTLELTVEATSFRSVAQVSVNGAALARVGGSDRWRGRVPLADGLNVLALRAVDAQGAVGADTAYAYRLSLTRRERPPLPEPRGGLTVTRLPGGTLLAAGGAAASGADARGEAWTLAPGADAWQPVPGGLAQPRTAHTATPLPDGRVLVAGGSAHEPPRTLSDLVSPFEAFDPAAGRFGPVASRGAAVLRALHTAFARTEQGTPVVELVGGRGNIALSAEALRYGVRDDVRTFALTRDTLRALSPSAVTGQGLPVEPVEGHATVAVGAQRWRTAGVTLDASGPLRQAFALVQIGERLGIDASPLPLTGRFRAAAAPGLPGEMWTAGGLVGADGQVGPGGELFALRADRSFAVGGVGGRYGAAAYPDGEGGLCLVGGFDAGGAATGEHVCFAR